MMVSVVTTFAVVLLSSLVVGESDNCLEIQTACNLDSVCRPLQTKYLQDCQSMLAQAGVACSQTCRDSYHELLANAKGATFYQCDCGSGALSSTCKTFTDNLLDNCFGGVAPTPPPVVAESPTESVSLAVESCTSVTLSCAYNPTCQQLYRAYISNSSCESAIQGVSCSPQCNQSYYNLLRNSVGSKFLSCSCKNDTVCVHLANLYRVCYNGSIPKAPPTEPTPTHNPPGTCEAFQEKCYMNNYGTCGSAFESLSRLCANQANETCPADCVAEMNRLLSTISYAKEILTCKCANASSTTCNAILAYQSTLIFCLGVTFPTVATTPAPTQYPRDSCEGLNKICIQQFGIECGNSQRQVFEGNCSYLSNAQGTVKCPRNRQFVSVLY